MENLHGEELSVADEWTLAKTFLFADEAKPALAALESAGMSCYLADESLLNIVWTWNFAVGGLRLMVPQAQQSEALEILHSEMSVEELAVLMGEVAAGPSPSKEKPRRRATWKWWIVMMLFAMGPDVDRLVLLYIPF